MTDLSDFKIICNNNNNTSKLQKPDFVDQVLHKLKSIVSKMQTPKERKDDSFSIIENDFDGYKFGDKFDHHIPGFNCYGTFEDGMEMKQCKLLARRIKEALSVAREEELNCEILVPCGLIMKIAQDILRMSHDEPCGLRGCVLYINLEEKNKCKHLIKLACDPNTVSTFELHLTLKEDTRSWCYVKKLLISFSGCFQHKSSLWNPSFKILCAGFVLEKKKLYRRNH